MSETTVVVVEGGGEETVIEVGVQGVQGPPGEDGLSTITAETETDQTGFLVGDGATVVGRAIVADDVPNLSATKITTDRLAKANSNVNTAFKDEANSFTANQSITGTLQVSSTATIGGNLTCNGGLICGSLQRSTTGDLFFDVNSGNYVFGSNGKIIAQNIENTDLIRIEATDQEGAAELKATGTGGVARVQGDGGVEVSSSGGGEVYAVDTLVVRSDANVEIIGGTEVTINALYSNDYRGEFVTDPGDLIESTDCLVFRSRDTGVTRYIKLWQSPE